MKIGPAPARGIVFLPFCGLLVESLYFSLHRAPFDSFLRLQILIVVAPFSVTTAGLLCEELVALFCLAL